MLSTTQPATGTTQRAHSPSPCHTGIVQGVWGAADVFEDMYRPGATGDNAAPNILSCVDIVAPIVLQVLQWPSAAEPGSTLTPPPLQQVDPDGRHLLLKIAQWVLGGVPPAVHLVGKVIDEGTFNENVEPYLVMAAEYSSP